MKISSFIVIALIISGFLFIQSSHIDKYQQNSGSIYTTAVKKVIDNKCYSCHSNNGKSLIAKNALMWDNLPNLQKKDMVAHLNKIIRVLSKSMMPPGSMVKKFPEMKLLPEESKLLQSWAEAKADSLLN